MLLKKVYSEATSMMFVSNFLASAIAWWLHQGKLRHSGYPTTLNDACNLSTKANCLKVKAKRNRRISTNKISKLFSPLKNMLDKRKETLQFGWG